MESSQLSHQWGEGHFSLFYDQIILNLMNTLGYFLIADGQLALILYLISDFN